MNSRLLAWAAALEESDLSIFADDLCWHRGVALSRGLTEQDVALALDGLRETTVESLPARLQATARDLFDGARARVRSRVASSEACGLASDAKSLFDCALVGDARGARLFLIDRIRSGDLTIERAILECVLPAAREAGRRWHAGELGIAVEHVISTTLRTALHAVGTEVRSYEPNGMSIFLAGVAGDAHELGLVAFSILLEADGWRVVNAGANTPIEEIEDAAQAYQCDLIALSATLIPQRSVLARFLESRSSTIPVMIGGRAIRNEEDAARLGADAFSPDLASGAARAKELARAGVTRARR